MKHYLILMAVNITTTDNDIPCVYIEKTDQTIDQRKKFHYLMSQTDNPTSDFHKAVKALGANQFSWEVLDECDTEEEALELERFHRLEYKSGIIGYNTTQACSVSASMSNPRYGDHRTLVEMHGAEKAEQVRQKLSQSHKGNPSMSAHTRARNLVNNPMDNPESRKKCSEAKMGTKNPKATKDYRLTLPDGSVVEFGCLREFVRNNPEYTKKSILMALRTGKLYKGVKVERFTKGEKYGTLSDNDEHNTD